LAIFDLSVIPKSTPNITPPAPPEFSGPDMFYIMMALSVLVRVIGPDRIWEHYRE
jgi:hypothetical protein